MKTIKDLFDSNKQIDRNIEKVITYNAEHPERLNAEIREYIVTESIDEQFRRLITLMQTAMDSGEQNDIGVWVSGFYGSGKSSFTKYLGLALDDRIQINGVPFLKSLQDRMLTPQSKAQLKTLADKFPAAVVMLDLASEMVAGATMEDVSTVLYYKVLQWAGYSRNLKIAALERKMQKEGRYDEFKQMVLDQYEMPWEEIQNDPLVSDSIMPELAHQMYPKQFKTPTSFNTETSDTIRLENERVKEMIDIVRDISGKDYVIFVVDEVGQYVASKDSLILNLDGLAKNLKEIGDGKVWIVGTAQQMLTEDDPRAALNSKDLFKLKDRFPIQIDLEASDIKEICYRRLLGKSPGGKTKLEQEFDRIGQSLRQHTKLQNAKFYDGDFNKETFAQLYPFLPAHFDILLHLLGALAKTTGGIGLRSAIKVIQDVLVEGPDHQSPVADNVVGWLCTTVTLYDSLEKDIRRAFPSIHAAVGKAIVRFPDQNCLHQHVAKTVAVLQILGNMPVTKQNVAALMHPAIDTPGRGDEVGKAIDDLIRDAKVPFGEKDGELCFFSEKLNDIEQERAGLPPRTTPVRKIFNDALIEAYKPLPSHRLDGTLLVTTGLKSKNGNAISALAGERDTVQTVIEFVDATNYEDAKDSLIADSRDKSNQATVFLIGRKNSVIDELVVDIYRCREIAERYRSDADQEVKEYCNAQSDRAGNLEERLVSEITKTLREGSFIFRATPTSVDSLHDSDLVEAAKKHLAGVAADVFDRYKEAPHRASTELAEKFLRLGNLKAASGKEDPLGLVKIEAGKPSIHTAHKALGSIRDYIDRNGTADGKQLTAKFTGAPFGWSQDTLRYLIAAMLCGGEVKLKVSGREVTVNGQQAIDALRTNQAFRSVGVALREGRPSIEFLAKAAERLTDLTGDQVLPLEDEISKATMKSFPQFQHKFGPLAERLERLSLPGADNIRSAMQQIADLLLTDASDAPDQLGSEESSVYESLKWAMNVSKKLDDGLEETIVDLKRHLDEIGDLPQSGVPAELKTDLADDFDQIRSHLKDDAFCNHTADLNSLLTAVKSRTSAATTQMESVQKANIEQAKNDLVNLPEWSELTDSEQRQSATQIDELAISADADLAGLKKRISQDYVFGNRVAAIKKGIEKTGSDRRRERLEQEREKAKQEGKTKLTRTVKLPSKLTTAARLDELIGDLRGLREELDVYKDIEVTIEIEA